MKLAQLTVTRLPDERLPKKVFYGELQEGKRSQGSQKKRYTDTLKASFKDFNISTVSWEQAAQDRTSGVVYSKKEPHNLNQRESVKLPENVKNGKQEPRIHHQTRQSPNSMLYMQPTV